MNDTDGPRRPTVERLLDVRTPAELACLTGRFAAGVRPASHGRRCRARSTPSDLYLIDGDGPTEAAHERSVERPHAGLVARWLAAGVPLGSHHARASTPVHDACQGGEPALAGTLRRLGRESSRGRATAGDCWSLVADPGCYGLDWSARAVTGAGPRPTPSITPARRRPPAALPDRPRRPGMSRRSGRPALTSGRSTGTGTRPSSPSSSADHSGWIGLVRRRRGPCSTSRRASARTLYAADVADRVAVALTRRDARRGDGGIRERPRTARAAA